MRPDTYRYGIAALAKAMKRHSERDREILFSLVEQNLGILESKKRDSRANEKKLKAWRGITMEYNANPDITRKLSPKKVRKFWQNLKLKAKEDITNENLGLKATGDISQRIYSAIPEQFDPLENNFDGDSATSSSASTISGTTFHRMSQTGEQRRPGDGPVEPTELDHTDAMEDDILQSSGNILDLEAVHLGSFAAASQSSKEMRRSNSPLSQPSTSACFASPNASISSSSDSAAGSQGSHKSRRMTLTTSARTMLSAKYGTPRQKCQKANKRNTSDDLNALILINMKEEHEAKIRVLQEQHDMILKKLKIEVDFLELEHKAKMAVYQKNMDQP